jgi:hypothetical protein
MRRVEPAAAAGAASEAASAAGAAFEPPPAAASENDDVEEEEERGRRGQQQQRPPPPTTTRQRRSFPTWLLLLCGSRPRRQQRQQQQQQQQQGRRRSAVRKPRGTIIIALLSLGLFVALHIASCRPPAQPQPQPQQQPWRLLPNSHANHRAGEERRGPPVRAAAAIHSAKHGTSLSSNAKGELLPPDRARRQPQKQQPPTRPGDERVVAVGDASLWTTTTTTMRMRTIPPPSIPFLLRLPRGQNGVGDPPTAAGPPRAPNSAAGRAERHACIAAIRERQSRGLGGVLLAGLASSGVTTTAMAPAVQGERATTARTAPGGPTGDGSKSGIPSRSAGGTPPTTRRAEILLVGE